MKHLIALLGLSLVLSIFAADAAEKSDEIKLTGTLKVVAVKSAKTKKNYLKVYLVEAKNKTTQIRLKLTDKSQTPKVKPLNGKKVEIVGKGSTRVSGKSTTVTLTEIEKFAEAAQAPAAE